MFCLAALRRTRFGSTQVLTLRLPLPSVYPRVLTHSLLWHIGAVQVYRVAIRRIPATGSLPLRGRQAELDESQTTRSEPRRKLPFTGHRSSSFAGVSEKPRKIKGVQPLGAGGFLGTFCPHKKYPRGTGLRQLRLTRVIVPAAQRPLGRRKRRLGLRRPHLAHVIRQSRTTACVRLKAGIPARTPPG